MNIPKPSGCEICCHVSITSKHFCNIHRKPSNTYFTKTPNLKECETYFTDKQDPLTYLTKQQPSTWITFRSYRNFGIHFITVKPVAKIRLKFNHQQYFDIQPFRLGMFLSSTKTGHTALYIYRNSEDSSPPYHLRQPPSHWRASRAPLQTQRRESFVTSAGIATLVALSI